MKKYRGRFIVMDGCEGAGKTTIRERSQKEFGDRVLCTREPGGSKYAEIIRAAFLHPEAEKANAMTKFALAWAARADHLHHTIAPALEAGKLVICDRFDAATYAYNVVAEGGEKEHLQIFFWNMRAQYLGHGDWFPDLYAYFDIDPLVGLGRKAQDTSGKNYLDEKPLTFHAQVREGFRQFMSHLQQSERKTIDASLDPEEVWKIFKELIEGQLKLIV